MLRRTRTCGVRIMKATVNLTLGLGGRERLYWLVYTDLRILLKLRYGDIFKIRREKGYRVATDHKQFMHIFSSSEQYDTFMMIYFFGIFYGLHFVRIISKLKIINYICTPLHTSIRFGGASILSSNHLLIIYFKCFFFACD